MPDKRFAQAQGRLPYASEIFGIYRPMVGWASQRKRDRILDADDAALPQFLKELLAKYRSGNTFDIDGKWYLNSANIGVLDTGGKFLPAPVDQGTFLLPILQQRMIDLLGPGVSPTEDFWPQLLDETALKELYDSTDETKSTVVTQWKYWASAHEEQSAAAVQQLPGETDAGYQDRIYQVRIAASQLARAVLDRESKLAGALRDVARMPEGPALLSGLFAAPGVEPQDVEVLIAAARKGNADPFTQFDPRDQLTGVSLSPLGIVHYFRQFFFELDSFLGPSVGHVWLAPGSTVELVESSTRRTVVERSTEAATETKVSAESAVNTKDELSEAIKQENHQDTKLGFSTTVNQSWPAGDATATGSMDLNTTQQLARETTHQRLREQSDKLATELRNQFKTTFKTVTETTDVSSRRYVISNPSDTALQNYELRRKMRQVIVQVQDIGTYLCWETFVDDPGKDLGLSKLVHVAKPPDTTPVQNPALIPIPERKAGIIIDVKASWPGDDDRKFPQAGTPGLWLGSHKIAVDVPDGYEIEIPPNGIFQLECLSATGDEPGQFRQYQYLARHRGPRELDVYLAWGPGGLEWDESVALDLRGTVAMAPTPTRIAEIEATNAKSIQEARDVAAAATARAAEEKFIEAAQERINLASAVKPRPFVDLREEERTVVYRNLVADLMARDRSGGLNYAVVSDERRHVYATVINAIFDIDRMLYFVAPEWWKPRRREHLMLGGKTAYPFGPDKVVQWNAEGRDADYHITGSSQPARLGSSLGWLLQLDGDDQRNRFLNAPWVRAVIPVRPGKEQAALEWLSRAGVEGTKGLSDSYAAESGEADEIKAGLAGTAEPAQDPPTLRDALRYLSKRVEEKHREAATAKLFPDTAELPDADKVMATPLEKVYEYGFYPLDRSFRAHPLEDKEQGESENFQVTSQWLEVVPTDQVVPVPVNYHPITGRMLPPEE